MDVTNIVAEIDAKILYLQNARTVLLSLFQNEVLPAPQAGPTPKRRGRPKGSRNTTTASQDVQPAKTRKRKLSLAGRKAISEAMKRRWADLRKQEK